MSLFEPLGPGHISHARRNMSALTDRERTVLKLAGDGLTANETAFELRIATRTVEVHRANILTKLGAKSLSQAMRLVVAAELNLAIAVCFFEDLYPALTVTAHHFL